MDNRNNKKRKGNNDRSSNQNNRNDQEGNKSERVEMKQDFIVLEDGTCQVDGSSLEGGGQILRNTVSLGALLQKTIKVVNIRGKRDRPGLQKQHLTGISLVRELCAGQLQGGNVDSMEINFKPSPLVNTGKTQFIADTQTAGSICLLMQCSLPVCVYFPANDIHLILKGGTNASNAPQIDYTELVFAPISSLFGVNFTMRIVRRGYYPKGGGELELVCKCIPQGTALKPVQLVDRGHVVSIQIRTFFASLPPKVGQRISTTAESIIKKYVDELTSKGIHTPTIAVQTIEEKSGVGVGCGILILATTSTGCLIAGSSLGEQGKPAEKVGEEAAAELIRNLGDGGCVDEYLQDQLIIFMALANGFSRVRCGPLTLHTRTSIHFSEMLTGAKFTFQTFDNKAITMDQISDTTPVIVECQGINFIRK